MSNRWAAVAMLAVAACACANSRTVARQQATAKVAESERDEMFARALSVVQRRGWRIATSDQAAGLITSEWMDTGRKPCGVLVCDSRSMLQVSVAAHGTVTLEIRREFDATKTYPPGRDGPQNQKEYLHPYEAEELLADIVGPRGATTGGLREGLSRASGH